MLPRLLAPACCVTLLTACFTSTPPTSSARSRARSAAPSGYQLTHELLDDLLAQSSGDLLRLEDYSDLAPGVVERLAAWPGRRLALHGRALDEHDAAMLATAWNGDALSVIGALEPGIAMELAAWSGDVLSIDIGELSVELADTLASSRARALHLHRVTVLDAVTAGSLASFGGVELRFVSLTALTPEVAELLARWSGEVLRFEAVTTLTEHVARTLTTVWHGHHLAFPAVRTLDEATARAFGSWRSAELELPRLCGLTDRAFEELRRYQGLTTTSSSVTTACTER